MHAGGRPVNNNSMAFLVTASFVYYLSDYDALRALDSDNPPDAPSMTEEEINALPVHKYKVQFSSRQRQDQILYLYMDFVFSNGGSVLQQASSSSISATEVQKRQEATKLDGNLKTPEDELTCSVCLEQVNVGELVRSLPCLHQVSTSCNMLDLMSK
ncbi:hypothetical protein BHM03_00001152 [Ensete ventricosum]|nr:hypothetical protein BHM03_00001152 [Ensete ventricosum]